VSLCIPALLHRPGIIVETVLPSITSSQLSHISLQLEGEDCPEIDHPAWAVAEKHFCRLAKRFSAGNPGKKMVVSVFGDDAWYRTWVSHFVGLFGCKEYLSRSKEEVMFSLPV